MKDFFRKVKMEYVVQSLVIIAIGVVLIAWAPAVIPLMARILAALLFVVGVLFVLSYFFKKERGFVDSGSFAFGIIVAQSAFGFSLILLLSRILFLRSSVLLFFLAALEIWDRHSHL